MHEREKLFSLNEYIFKRVAKENGGGREGGARAEARKSAERNFVFKIRKAVQEVVCMVQNCKRRSRE